MKTLFFSFLFIALFSQNIIAQKKVKELSSTDLTYNIAYAKYKNAIKYLDYTTAINAVHEILIAAPEKTSFEDTLLMLYSTNNQNSSAVLLAREMEGKGKANLNVYEVLAMTYQQAGYMKESLSYYEKIITIDDNLFYNYQIATIQFNLSRLKECSNTLNKIISNPEAKKQTVQIDYENQQAQKVPYASAAYNILGVLSMQLKENASAQKYFTDALALYPDFILAKNNLDYLKKN